MEVVARFLGSVYYDDAVFFFPRGAICLSERALGTGGYLISRASWMQGLS